ncbi:hypothetical protein HYDPIDRAFT_81520 [Hydnomerulius pinastri MD-312]|nr:hypothetical protein HYDPIDRAFT_81520 [Hydnomerulius pinastri MD-312]
MGSLCSKPGTHSGGHQVLGGNTASPNAQNYGTTSNPRAAAAEAAERRLKSAQARGTNASNPKRGRLAAQLEASKSAKAVPTSRQEEQVVVSGLFLTRPLPLFINFITVGLNEIFVNVLPQPVSPTCGALYLNILHLWPSGFLVLHRA